MFFDSNYLILVMLPTLILSGLAQMFVRSAYAKWGNIQNGLRLNGGQVGERLSRSAGLGVRFEGVPGELTDHYDPRSHTVRISAGNASRPSVAAMAITAHELGHAQQHQEKSPLIGLRSFLLPAVQFSPTIAYGLIMAGLLLQIGGLAQIGLLFFGVVVIFMILTLPVEIDASLRGLRLLEEHGFMVTEGDRSGARQVLIAAALTYVAAAITAILQLLYWISVVQRSSRR